MFCRYCGKEIEDDAEFCPNCGKSQANISAGDVTPPDPEEWSPPEYDEEIEGLSQSTASQGGGDSNQPKRRIRGLVITIVILAIIAALALFFLVRTTIRQNQENEVVQEEVREETQSEEIESEEIAADSSDTVETEETTTEEIEIDSGREETQQAAQSTQDASETPAVFSEDNVEAVPYEPGTNAQDGTMLPLDTYVNITLQRGEHAWVKFMTGDVNNASYTITVVDKVNNKTNEVNVRIVDGQGIEQGSLTANGEGSPTTCTCTKLLANTAYNIDMFFADYSWYDDTLDYVDVDMIIQEAVEE